jgi:hypothetical protein
MKLLVPAYLLEEGPPAVVRRAERHWEDGNAPAAGNRIQFAFNDPR